MILEIPYEIIEGCNPIILNPMYSKTEKSILEYSIMCEESLVFEYVCKTLNIPDWLPLHLKIACIYKVREISFGSDLPLRYKCNHCHQLTESTLLIENILIPNNNNKIKEKKLETIFKSGITESYKLFDAKKPTTIREAAYYAALLKTSIPNIKSTLDCKCLFCGTKKSVNITNRKFILNSLSEQTTLSMYKLYNALALNGFTKWDVD